MKARATAVTVRGRRCFAWKLTASPTAFVCTFMKRPYARPGNGCWLVVRGVEQQTADEWGRKRTTTDADRPHTHTTILEIIQDTIVVDRRPGAFSASREV